MKKSIPLIKILATFGLVLAASAAGAQSWQMICTNAGANASEPLGDRDKHSIHVQAATCTHETGPFSGAITTQGVIWEHDATGSRLLSGDGVGRKPGLTIAFRVTEGALTWVMKDGKPAGWNAQGKGVYILAAGEASEFKGKTFSWTSHPTGARTYVTEVKVD